jgi:hypothetical protein
MANKPVWESGNLALRGRLCTQRYHDRLIKPRKLNSGFKYLNSTSWAWKQGTLYDKWNEMRRFPRWEIPKSILHITHVYTTDPGELHSTDHMSKNMNADVFQFLVRVVTFKTNPHCNSIRKLTWDINTVVLFGASFSRLALLNVSRTAANDFDANVREWTHHARTCKASAHLATAAA